MLTRESKIRERTEKRASFKSGTVGGAAAYSSRGGAREITVIDLNL